MPVTLFVSHSFADGRRQADELVRRLEASGAQVWAPTKQMRLGRNWLQQAGDTVGQADAVVLVMTEDALRLDSACRTECIVAQSMGTPVIPVRMSEVETYPQYVAPGVTWVDLHGDPGSYALLERELGLMAAHGAHRMVIDRKAWDLGDGPFSGDGAIFVGRWLVTRRLRPGERMALIPDYVMDLQPTSRYWSRPRGRVVRRLQIHGSWGFDPPHRVLSFIGDDGKGRTMSVDTHHGPNKFGGLTSDGRRYVAERLLELD